MVKSDPLRKGGCGDEKCMVCTSEGKGSCRRNGAGYRITCLECPEDGLVTEYEGETGRNGYSRGLEHQNGLRNEDESNPLWKHCTIQHGGRKVHFRMDILKTFKYPLMRQNDEGVRVKCSKADILMNSRSEFHQPGIVRVVAYRGNLNEEQTGAVHNPSRGRGRAGRSMMAGRNQEISPRAGVSGRERRRRGSRPGEA